MLFTDLGPDVMVTELDIDVLPKVTEEQSVDISVNVAFDGHLNPYTSGFPDSV